MGSGLEKLYISRKLTIELLFFLYVDSRLFSIVSEVVHFFYLAHCR